MDTNPNNANMHADKPVRDIIDRFIPEGLRLSRIADPNHLQSLATELGVKNVLTRPLTGIQDQHPGVDAMLVPLTEGYSVVINDHAPLVRQQYSFAHELGHIMLLATAPPNGIPSGSTLYRSTSSKTKDRKTEERLCEAIAAELLMPEKLFKAEIRESGSSLNHLPRWASLYKTSLTATAIRYWELLPEPCHLIKWTTPLNREGEIVPVWQMRNRARGLRLYPVMGPSKSRLNAFLSIHETWSTLKTSVSHERLLIKSVVAGRQYAQTSTFETESVGFGNGKSRAALSAVYLSRTVPGNS